MQSFSSLAVEDKFRKSRLITIPDERLKKNPKSKIDKFKAILEKYPCKYTEVECLMSKPSFYSITSNIKKYLKGQENTLNQAQKYLLDEWKLKNPQIQTPVKQVECSNKQSFGLFDNGKISLINKSKNYILGVIEGLKIAGKFDNQYMVSITKENMN